MKISTYLSVATLTLVSLSATAQGQMPKVEWPIQGKDVILNKMSDNGKWAVSQTASTTDGDLRSIGGTLFDMDTFQSTPIRHDSGFVGVGDVTDDGNIVVGSCENVPAYWSKTTGEWTKLPIPDHTFLSVDGKLKPNIGALNAVTPDGHYAVGYVGTNLNELFAESVAYDLTTGELLELPGLPTLDQTHLNQNMRALYDISPDGRYILGMLSQAYLFDADVDGGVAPLCTFVYDRDNDTYDMIGFIDHADKRWEPEVDNLFFVTDPSMSNNGEWVTGSAYLVEEIPGSKWPNETYHPFRYNVKTQKIEVYSTSADSDIIGFSIDNNGVVYGATPAQNPYPNCVVRSGDYFISLEQIFRQVYGYDFAGTTGYTVTGKPLCISNDGKTVVMLPDPDGTYVLKMPESLAEAAGKVKLLGNYSVDPEEGVKISRLSTITITFDRNIKVIGEADDVVFASADGKEVYTPVSSGLNVDGKKLLITFRPRNLNEDTKYVLTIPEGTVAMVGNENEVNNEITVSYEGRTNKPVQALQITPRPDEYVYTLDMTSNPIQIQFDAEVKLVNGASAELYRNEDTNPLCALNIAVQGKNVILFPTAGQDLYNGSEYHVVIPAGSLTDISGGGANEEITFSYLGAYVRTFDPTDNYVFNDDCSTYANFMFYDGDHNTPDLTPEAWGFNSDIPWLTVRDDNSTDMALASHSMYSPVGKSDDWMTTPRLLIPDDKCYLQFDAQSFLRNANDVLDVYVYPCESSYNTLTAEFVNEIRTKGDLVLSEKLTPGSSEDVLENDWTNYRVVLDKYAQQNIYIAFVNQNDNQSAIFIDNVRVVHDQAYSTVFETPAQVVDKQSVAISGYMVFGSDLETYKSVKLVLSDEEGNELDTIEESGLSLTKGSQYDFKFDTELPLKLGETNTYYVEVSLDGKESSKITGKVDDLLFQPKRRIVLEEYTGSECGNCPLGIRAMENIEMLYPEVMIPITIRTYQSDKLGLTMGAYSESLGLDAMGAPSAFIDRKEYAYPMINVDGDYRFSGTGVPSESDPTQDERVWLDVFRSEYETPATLGLNYTTDLSADGKSVDVKLSITNALNKYRAAYKVFAVITEDGLTTYQKNYMSGVNDPDLGEWGEGGKYATTLVMPVEAHGVARQTWGTTYNGTAGLFPSFMRAGWGYATEFSIAIPEIVENVDNCNLVVMILDETNKVLNAHTCALVNGMTDPSGVDTVTGDEAEIGMTVIDGKLYINADGAYTVNAYDMAGSAILSAKGNGMSALTLNGYKGVLLVKAVDAEGNAKSAKFIVR
ncbi:MAG: Ig-like domain-containing protein [Muribaculaceae bacterium]|nr:Ig-like domain-containing protein [Muribaculaceae bacterium]